MKNLLFAFLAFIAVNASAQKKPSEALQDSIFLHVGAFEIEPLVVGIQNDTARSITWNAFDVCRNDSTAGFKTYIQLFDKNGKQVSDMNLNIPASVAKKWGANPDLIDDYILSQFQRIKKPSKKAK
ncbi:MAG: hypothetical protein IM569_13805 [Chitinophagaceae bacterium]|jgi:hypothetical protein|nr:hypothetical protein [Chitinophagaceae bacterium]MCA6513925.1 hypothetical protein [Chitinophagaceae bacterium]